MNLSTTLPNTEYDASSERKESKKTLERTFCFYVQTEEKEEVYRRLGSKSILPESQYQNGVYYGECSIESEGKVSKLKRTRLQTGEELQGYWLAQLGEASQQIGVLTNIFFPFVRTKDGSLFILPDEEEFKVELINSLSLDSKTKGLAKQIERGKYPINLVRMLSLDKKSLAKSVFMHAQKPQRPIEGNNGECGFGYTALNAYINRKNTFNQEKPLLIYRLKGLNNL